MKKEIKNLSAVLLIALAVGLTLGGCSGEEKKMLDVARDLMTQDGEVIMLVGDNGYQGVARYYEPNSEGLFTRMALVMFKDDKAAAYDMVTSRSASGAKFSTQEADYVMWEAKGEFSFYQGDAETLLSTLQVVQNTRDQSGR